MINDYQTLLEEIAEWFMQLFYDPVYYIVSYPADEITYIGANKHFETNSINNKLSAVLLMTKDNEFLQKLPKRAKEVLIILHKKFIMRLQFYLNIFIYGAKLIEYEYG